MNVKSGNGINKLPIFPLVSDCWCFLLRMAVSCLAGGLWRHNYFQLTCRTLTSTFKTTPLIPSAHNLSRCKPMQSSFYCSVPPFPNISGKPSFSSSLCRTGLLTPTRCSSSSQDGIHSNPVEKKDRIVTIPNLLCVSRIVAAPYIAYCIANADYATAAALFIYAGATDLADGAIARRYISSVDTIDGVQIQIVSQVSEPGIKPGQFFGSSVRQNPCRHRLSGSHLCRSDTCLSHWPHCFQVVSMIQKMHSHYFWCLSPETFSSSMLGFTSATCQWFHHSPGKNILTPLYPLPPSNPPL